MQSKLPLTGKCHYCGKATPYRFCCNDHGKMYHYRQTHPVVWQKNTVKHGGTLEDRINAIVQRAKAEHTLGWATLAKEL